MNFFLDFFQILPNIFIFKAEIRNSDQYNLWAPDLRI